nr:unnamed protein product [Callosobruchus analis]
MLLRSPRMARESPKSVGAAAAGQDCPDSSLPPPSSASEQHHGHGAHVLDYAPAPGWTAHQGGYHLLRHGKLEKMIFPMGGRGLSMILVGTTTSIVLERSPSLGFGFVAGSEKPVIVRFVTEGGPSVDKLLPGDQILEVNGEDVCNAPRERVISLVRGCQRCVRLTVCQPAETQGGGFRKSTLLSAGKRARLRTKPPRVRFAESVCVNGAPLFPPSAFSLGDVCVPPMANVLKVFLENGQTKSFKYDAWTTVQDVVSSLESKLYLKASEHFSLVVEHIKSLKRNKLTLLDPQDTLARIASRPGAHKLRCLFRVSFVPSSAAALAQKDLQALDYLYTQCCNDVVQERFAPELQPDTALRLAALHVYQHAMANGVQQAAKITVKAVEREFGLERFVPGSLLEGMKRKEVRKVLSHFLKLHATMASSGGKQLTQLQAKLHYLDIVAQLPSYGAKCFSATATAGAGGEIMGDTVILVSPKFGISQITGTRNSAPIPIASIEDMVRIEVKQLDEVSRMVKVLFQDDRYLAVTLEERDAGELVLVLRGYYRVALGGDKELPIEYDSSLMQLQHRMEDLAPPYLAQHRVVPEKWSYMSLNTVKTACFAIQPPYRPVNKKTNGLYNTVGRQPTHARPALHHFSTDNNMNNNFISNRNHQVAAQAQAHQAQRGSYDFQSVLRRVHEMQQLVQNSERYLSEQEHLENQQQRSGSSEWQETSVDVESDCDCEPGQLKHSDSLLLLTGKTQNGIQESEDIKNSLSNSMVELLRQESAGACSESDNESIYTPHTSPGHRTRQIQDDDTKMNRISFGLRSPDTGPEAASKDGQPQQHSATGAETPTSADSVGPVYIFDPDIIDLTLLPPPHTPDLLEHPTNLVDAQPPRSFADSMERLNDIGTLGSSKDLEEFLASVTVLPPTQKVTPAVELTPEEIMSYIIPPPPSQASLENLTKAGVEEKDREEGETKMLNGTLGVKGDRESMRRHSDCAGGRGGEEKNNAQPKRASPDRPPKNSQAVGAPTVPERQRSQSLSAVPPKPSPQSTQQQNSKTKQDGMPSHLFLPPKKPPLPPVPPLDIMRQKKSHLDVVSDSSSLRTAGIGSPHLQRTRIQRHDVEQLEADQVSGGEVSRSGSIRSNGKTAISTPTSPYLGKRDVREAGCRRPGLIVALLVKRDPPNQCFPRPV